MRTPCDEWQGSRTKDGYGLRGGYYAHRIAAAEVHGWDALDGKVVMHLCDNPPCINVEHLRIGTQLDNMRDMTKKGRRRNGNESKTHCPQGHEYDEANTYRYSDGRRACRTCARHKAARRRARRGTR